MELSERKKREIRALSDASYEALVALVKLNTMHSKPNPKLRQRTKTKA